MSLISRRTRGVLVLVAVSLAASAVGFAAARAVESPAQVAARTAPPPPSVITVAVERRILRDVVVLRGTIGPARVVQVTIRGAQGDAEPVVTGVRVRVGDPIGSGDVLLEVSGRPVIALAGSFPFYRDLRPGTEGRDVAQLQRALSAIGHRVAVSGRYDSATKAAVNAYYDDIGYDVVPADPDDRDQLRAAARAVVDARAAEADAEVARDDAYADAAAEPGDVGLSRAARDADRVLQRARRAAADARAEQGRLVTTTGPMVPLREVVTIPVTPTRVQSLAARLGDAPTSPAVTLATGESRVVADVPGFQRELLRRGQPVQITEDQSGRSVAGVVSAVGVAESPPRAGSSRVPDDLSSESERSGESAVDGEPPALSTGADGPDRTVVTVAARTPLPASWTGKDVRVTITAAASAGPVLVVPLAAVSASADGRTSVTVVPQVGPRRRVAVTAGISAGGYVAVSPGSELTAGEEVLIGAAPGQATP